MPELETAIGKTSGRPPTPHGDAVIVVDDEARIVDWNGAAEDMLGYRRAEVLGRLSTQLLTTATYGPALERRFEIFKNGELDLPPGQRQRPYLTSLRHRDGSEIRVLARAGRTRTDPSNLVVSLRELEPSEREDAEQRGLRTILDSSEDAMAILSSGGIVRAWNPAAEEIFGFAAAEAIGERLADLVVPDDLMHEPRSWSAAVMRGESVELETRRLRKDRSEVRVLMRMLPVRDSFEVPIGSVVIAREVADRQKREERRTAEAEDELWRTRIDACLVGKERSSAEGFRLAAQPVVDLRSGEVHHHELLLRMRLGDRLIPPAEFIGRAEESGQIREIDLWVVRHGLEVAERMPVSINVSIRSLSNLGLFAVIDERLREGSLDPRSVTFEITETATVADLEQAVLFARRLKDLGCRVSLDDFGTGFGSFTYLSRLPACELKIDRQFVDGMVGDDARRRVVRATIALARSFGLRTVAEGVETEEEAELLAAWGVDLGQGYLFGRPRMLHDPVSSRQ